MESDDEEPTWTTLGRQAEQLLTKIGGAPTQPIDEQIEMTVAELRRRRQREQTARMRARAVRGSRWRE